MATTDLDFVTSQRVPIAQSVIAFSGVYDILAALLHVVLQLLYFSYLPWFEFFYWALERLNEFKKDLSEVCLSCVHMYACARMCVYVWCVCASMWVCVCYGCMDMFLLGKWDELVFG